jgi:hypothetical protein
MHKNIVPTNMCMNPIDNKPLMTIMMLVKGKMRFPFHIMQDEVEDDELDIKSGYYRGTLDQQVSARLVMKKSNRS